MILAGRNEVRLCGTSMRAIVEEHLRHSFSVDAGLELRVTDLTYSDHTFIIEVTTDKTNE